MAKRDLHAAKLTLKNRRATSVRARVVLAGRPSLLHAGQMVERLGLTVSIPGPLTRVHAVFPTALHRVASHPGVGHVIHVLHAVVHHGEPKQSTIKKKVPQLSVLKKESRFQKKKKKNQVKEGASSHVNVTIRSFLVWKKLHRLHRATAPPATTRPNWEAEIYDDAEL